MVQGVFMYALLLQLRAAVVAPQVLRELMAERPALLVLEVYLAAAAAGEQQLLGLELEVLEQGAQSVSSGPETLVHSRQLALATFNW
jgi:hypothetical protein